MRSQPTCDRRGCVSDCPNCGAHVYRSHNCTAAPRRALTPVELDAAVKACRSALRGAVTVQEVLPLA